jgi:serine-type D-Ala-D-Ala endopeptidase (penicillin-binding protein 7)
MLKKLLFLLLAGHCATGSAALTFDSAHALVVDEATGEVLLEKNSGAAAPIASLTKLMTAMVVLDAGQDPAEPIRIEDEDLDRLKHTHSGVPVGATFARRTLLALALMSSDNHAAAALARSYPGGLGAFTAAMQQKLRELDLDQTVVEEPTGLSSGNHASAVDLVKVLRAAAAYPEIAQITTQSSDVVEVNGRPTQFRNTNGFVGKPGWGILLSKTGFTDEAGRCLAMRMEAAGRTVLVVLMGARATAARTLDALNVRRWLSGEQPLLAQHVPAARRLRVARARQPVREAVASVAERHVAHRAHRVPYANKSIPFVRPA